MAVNGIAAENEKDVVLITGCSDGGLGAAMALEFAACGFCVVATSRSVETMKKLSAHENIHPRALDVNDYEGARAVVESIISNFGHIDILVNNAGLPCVAPVAEMPISFLEATFRTNVFAPVVLINAVVPHMVRRGKGRIVNIGSIVSLCYGPWAGGYESSKAALEALTDALRLELRPFGIGVMLIQPGTIKSNIGVQSLSRIQANVLAGLNLYKPFEDVILLRATISQNPKSTPSAVFAKNAVAQMVAKWLPAHFVTGRMGTLYSILHYMPFWIRDYIFMKQFKLDGSIQAPPSKKND